MNDVKVLIWSMNESITYHKDKFRKLIDTADYFNITLNYMGVGVPYKNHKQKIEVLHDHLKNSEYSKNTIIICMDGTDTLFNNNIDNLLNRFLEKNTRILFSAEKAFTYQWPAYKQNFDNLNYPYKYLNAGTFMGYAEDIKEMLVEIKSYEEYEQTQIDQGLFGIWTSKNLKNTQKVQMDGTSDIFWVVSNEWRLLYEVFKKEKSLVNPNTNTTPVIIHNTGLNSFQDTYDFAYNKIIGINL